MVLTVLSGSAGEVRWILPKVLPLWLSMMAACGITQHPGQAALIPAVQPTQQDEVRPVQIVGPQPHLLHGAVFHHALPGQRLHLGMATQADGGDHHAVDQEHVGLARHVVTQLSNPPPPSVHQQHARPGIARLYIPRPQHEEYGYDSKYKCIRKKEGGNYYGFYTISDSAYVIYNNIHEFFVAYLGILYIYMNQQMNTHYIPQNIHYHLLFLCLKVNIRVKHAKCLTRDFLSEIIINK